VLCCSRSRPTKMYVHSDVALHGVEFYWREWLVKDSEVSMPYECLHLQSTPNSSVGNASAMAHFMEVQHRAVPRYSSGALTF
jgi:hypothetical protein